MIAVIFNTFPPRFILQREHLIFFSPLPPFLFQLLHFARILVRQVMQFERVGLQVNQFPLCMPVGTHQFPIPVYDGARTLVFKVEYPLLTGCACNSRQQTLARQVPAVWFGACQLQTSRQEVNDMTRLKAKLPCAVFQPLPAMTENKRRARASLKTPLLVTPVRAASLSLPQPL